MGESKIEWTDVTWNPIRGCSVISPGCVNCYAMKQAHRFSGNGEAYEGLTKQTTAGPQWTGDVRLAEDHLLDPLRWNTPRRVFVNSMSDLFHERVPDDAIDQFFAVMAMARWHTFQVLTKRADRMHAYLANEATRERINLEITMILEGYEPDAGQPKALQVDPHARRSTDMRATAPDVEADDNWPLPNVWLGVSVENQKYADERIPLLLQTPAAVRFVSYEPALGPLRVDQLMVPTGGDEVSVWNALTGTRGHKAGWHSSGVKLDWVIVGLESGNRARPGDIEWVRSVVKQCASAGVACFAKQLGANPYERDDQFGTSGIIAGYSVSAVVLGDRKGGDMAEWPEDLRVRQFPEGRR